MTKEEKYMDVLLSAVRQNPGTIIHINISHDEGCPALRSNSLRDCTCEPDIEVMEQG